MDSALATILVVEDSRATRTFLADNLTADGYDVVECGCLVEAHALLAAAFPDLAIVDLGLPDGDGLDLLDSVRGTDRASGRIDPDLPMLALTGRAAELDRLRGFERGADDYLVKPFSYQELRGVISSFRAAHISGFPGVFSESWRQSRPRKGTKTAKYAKWAGRDVLNMLLQHKKARP